MYSKSRTRKKVELDGRGRGSQTLSTNSERLLLDDSSDVGVGATGSCKMDAFRQHLFLKVQARGKICGRVGNSYCEGCY